MNTVYRIMFLFFLLSLLQEKGTCQQAEDSTKLYQLKAMDGNEYLGILQVEDSSGVSIKTAKLGLLFFPRSEIKSLVKIEPKRLINGKVWFENPQSSRYLWAPNGYGLHKGEGYYQNIWVLYNQFSYGITDNFSIGAGVLPLFFFSSDVTPIWIIPKFSIPVVRDKFNVGVGILAARLVGQNTGLGIVYGTGTLGNRDRNISLGMGYGYIDGSLAKLPMWNLSFMYRVGMKGYLVSENYLFTGNNYSLALLSFGGRVFIKVVGLDFGLVLPRSGNIKTFIAIPWFGFTVPFGKKSPTSH
ncbi:MAG: hypothetical protein HXX13_04930 [Bacteroidetes bacterium]|nr:hypothetical protein [Bacteroidota bacterium]